MARAVIDQTPGAAEHMYPPRTVGEFGVVPACTVTIPRTTRESYVTGIYALNLQPPEGTTGDWHDVFHWRDGVDEPRQITLGGSTKVNTNHIYRDLGVYEDRRQIEGRGLPIASDADDVYIANHFRAILDLVHQSLTTYDRVVNLNCATVDWLDTPEEQKYVLELATQMADYLTPAQQIELSRWIEMEYQR